MFYRDQPEKAKISYKRFINAAAIIGRLNNPRSTLPQIHTKASEEIFCRAFSADNLGAKDISIDAYKPDDGFGIKTFQGGRQQKIAEFNDSHKYLFPNESLDIAQTVSEYRNSRLNESIQNYGLNRMIYHYLYRTTDQQIQIFEQEMSLINLNNIELQSSKKGIVRFSDGKNLYTFNKSKSILYKSFNISSPLESILFDPDKMSDVKYYIDNVVDQPKSNKTIQSVVLPLYSERLNDVPTKSGINGWNGAGRPRDFNEVEIRIPKRIHRESPGFFPERDKTFRLHADNDTILLAKVCQQGNKALMSNPNKSLGEWLLRKKLGLSIGQIATFDYLKRKKIDSVLIEKIDQSNFKISVQNK